MALTPSQCRAARALIDMKQEELAEASGIAVNTIRKFEGGETTPHQSNREKIREAFEKAGVIFIDRTPDAGPGVRLRK